MKLNIGENIRRLRRAADMTQEQLADKLGVAYQSVSRWENGTTYPDMEFLPVLAGIFGVTVDELIGMEESKKKEQIIERFREYHNLCYSDTPDRDAIVALIRELKRDCMTDSALSAHLWQLFGFAHWNAESLLKCPDVLAELRLAAEEILEGNYERLLKDAVVEHMSYIEDDEHIETFLDKYATEHDLTKDTLLFARYWGRDEWDKADVLRQKQLLSMLQKQFFNNGLFFKGNRPNNARECLQINTMQMNFLHGLCGVTPDPAHPITGDGSVDLFLGERLEHGIRRACYLASTGDPEGAFVVLEDTVSMLEKAMSLPDGTMLTCTSLSLEEESFELRHESREESGECRPILRLYHHRFGESDRVVTIGYGYPIFALTSPTGWEWFDPIRNDPRYAAYVERVKAVFAPVSEEEAQ